MNTCGLKIFVIFAALLVLVAVFFVPYNQTTVSTQSGPSGIGIRTTTEDNRTGALYNFLKIRGETTSARTGARVTTSLRADVYAFRIGAVIVLGVLDYLLFCVWMGRKKRPPVQD